MSLFPAYSEDTQQNDGSIEKNLNVQEEDATQPTPSWLINTSFRDFQENINKTQPIEVESSSEEDEIEILSDDSSSNRKNKRKKRKLSRSRSKSKEKKRKNKSARRRNSSSGSGRSKSRNRKRSKSRSRSKKRSQSRSRIRSKSRSRNRRSRSRNKDGKRKRNKRSRSRGKGRRSRSRNRRRSSSSDRENRSRHTLPRSRDEIIANSRYSSKKNFIEEVGVGVANSFREDRTGDKGNLTGTGMYVKDVAKYKTKLRYPLGRERKQAALSVLHQNPRFYHRSQIKKLIKTKHVRRITKDKVSRSKDEMKADFMKTYLDLACNTTIVKSEVEDYSVCNPLGIYDQRTEDWVRGVGGLGQETEELEVFENDEIQQRRLEYNRRLRDTPGDVELWMEFIDFQDAALEETVFRLEEDENSSKKARKSRGEILRAKALTERKLAICRSAIERNTRSIKLAVKRLELSRDLFDSKTLDQQWKELIFVYPENISLWKRYLLFVQTHYIRFSISDTVKTYKGCVLKLRSLLEQKLESKEEGTKILELEHGILDIVEQGALLLLQSGHSEKAIAIYQGMLELNLFSPSFPGPGYTVEDKLSLLEPIWDSGLAKVGQAGARGWGEELQDRIAQGNKEMEEIVERSDMWEEELLNQGGMENGAMWLKLEVGREREHFFPWRKGDAEPEDPERIVDFDTIHEWMAEFSRPETKFRLLLSLLRLLGVSWTDSQFSSLTHSSASDQYLNTEGHWGQDFPDCGARLLLPVLPSYADQENLAIFAHLLFAQTYSRFPEPYKSRLMSLWLDYEYSLVKQNLDNKNMKKDLKKLAKSLMKEDRNNVELVVQFVEIEYRLSGYLAGQAILETSILAGGRVLLLQEDEADVVAAARLYRVGVELELREIVKKRKEEQEQDTGLHRDRCQWILIQVGAKCEYKSLQSNTKTSMLAMVDLARTQYEEWLARRMDDPRKRIRVFQQAPFIRHSGTEVLFLYAWLLYFTLGVTEAVDILSRYSAQVEREVQGAEDRLAREERRSEEMLKSGGRFDEELLTLRFILESIDKIAFDMLWFESGDDISVKQKLRIFYLNCLKKHRNSGYFQSMLSSVETSTSCVSSVWREVTREGINRGPVSLGILEQVSRLGLSKLSSVLDPDCPGDLPVLGLGLLNRLRHLLERFTSLPSIRHSPLLWRLLLWTDSLLTARQHSKEAAEQLKTVLYRAIQEVPWAKALYLDTALYLDRIGELYQTTRQEVKYGEGEDHPEDEMVEPKFEEIPGSLEHVTELMVEKELRVRLPLQELEVLLEPI